MRVVVDAPSRLHLGFLDLDGACGRRFGSLGLALDRPRLVVEAGSAPAGAAAGGDPALAGVLDRLSRALGRPVPAWLEVREALPRHAGLGSGTQLELAVATAAARVIGETIGARELAARLGRGRRSGIGVSVFEDGGFVVDGGHRWPPAGQPDPATGEADVPPILARHPVPDDWRLVLVTPRAAPGLAGSAEEAAFRGLPPMGEAVVGRICRLVLLKVLPGVVTADLEAFGQGITEIQALVGEHFASLQGGRYATDLGEAAAALALREGAAGVGQSSWGPTVFALVRGDGAAEALAATLSDRVGLGGTVTWTRPRNRGARVTVEP